MNRVDGAAMREPPGPVDRVQNFIGFFERIFFDAFEGLLAIPWTTARSPQPRHDVNQPLKLLTYVVFSHLRGIPNVSFE